MYNYADGNCYLLLTKHVHGTHEIIICNFPRPFEQPLQLDSVQLEEC